MARYTGPKSKIARKFGEPIFGPDKALERRNYPSRTARFARRRRKISEYGVQLKEKKKQNILTVCWKDNSVSFLRELKVVRGVTGEVLFQLLECRWITWYTV